MKALTDMTLEELKAQKERLWSDRPLKIGSMIMDIMNALAKGKHMYSPTRNLSMDRLRGWYVRVNNKLVYDDAGRLFLPGAWVEEVERLYQRALAIEAEREREQEKADRLKLIAELSLPEER